MESATLIPEEAACMLPMCKCKHAGKIVACWKHVNSTSWMHREASGFFHEGVPALLACDQVGMLTMSRGDTILTVRERQILQPSTAQTSRDTDMLPQP